MSPPNTSNDTLICQNKSSSHCTDPVTEFITFGELRSDSERNSQGGLSLKPPEHESVSDDLPPLTSDPDGLQTGLDQLKLTLLPNRPANPWAKFRHCGQEGADIPGYYSWPSRPGHRGMGSYKQVLNQHKTPWCGESEGEFG